MSYNQQNYLESQVLSASPVELVSILYRAAIDSLETARVHLSSGDVGQRGRSISRAMEMVAELTQSLDRERGGDLAAKLVELYDYILRRIHQGSSQGDDAPLREAIKLLSTLLEAWQSIDPPERSNYEHSIEDHRPIQCSF